MKASKDPNAGVKQVEVVKSLRSDDTARLSVAEARRIMGKGSDAMSDEVVQKAIYDLTAIARAYVQSSSKTI